MTKITSLLTLFFIFIFSQVNASVPILDRGNVGIYHSYSLDMTVQRRPNWWASVNMSSSRIVGDKSIVLNNFADYYMEDGALYTYVDGNEYDNISAVWDWQKIPGITAYHTDAMTKLFEGTDPNNKSTFVGNVNNGSTGISAMQLDCDGLRASKLWIFTDDLVLCLGAGISSDRDLEVTTSIDQRIYRSDLKQLKSYRWIKTTSTDFESEPDVRFFHDKTGYIILNAQKGRAAVSQSTDAQKILSIWLDHGKKPQNANYQYLILPATTQKEVKNFDLNQIKILSNTPRLQSAKIGNVTYVAAYPLVDMNMMEGVRFQSSNTGLFMIEEEPTRIKVTVVDPTLLQTQMDVSLHGQTKTIQLPLGEDRGTPIVVYFDK